jgi:hypothetical protein
LHFAVRFVASAAVLATAAIRAHADPFPTRDQNPLLAGFGIPLPLPARSSSDWTFAADLNWGSTATIEPGTAEALIIDAETRELRLTLGHRVTERITLQAQLPYRYTGAGSLDGFIDTWHDLFSLPEGDRRTLRDDQFRIAYARNGVAQLALSSSQTGIGDASLDAGYQLLASEASAVSAWLSIKLPTGDADKLTGSGAVDVALSISGEHRVSERWSLFGQASVTLLGDGDLLPRQQRDFVVSGFGGVALHVTPGFALKAQVDAHSAAYDDSEIDMLGEAVILTVGGDVRVGDWLLNVGVSEDVAVEASPDVVFVFGLRRAW